MGKSKRDYATLIHAFAGSDHSDISLKIYAGGSYTSQSPEQAVQVINRWVPFKDSVPVYQHALFVVIPIEDTRRTIGLTSFYDALAAGKAVIVSRNAGIDVDVEAEKIGFWVKPGDERDLRDKMNLLFSQPETARSYGRNARRLVESVYPYRVFCEKLYAVAKSLTHGTVS